METTLKTSLSQPSLRSQLRAVWEIARKDWRRYWRYPLNAVSQTFQPLIWLTPVFFMGHAFSVNGTAAGFEAYSGTADYMSFVLLGTALANFISAVFWGMGYTLKEDMDLGVLEANWLAPLSRPLLLIGRTLTSLALTAITSVAMLLVASLLFGFHPTGNALAAVLTVIPMLLGLYGFGFAFAALVLVMRESNAMVDIGSFLLELFSGANFPVVVLPRWLLPISLAIPLTYGFDAVRGWLLHTRTLLPLPVEIGLLLVFMVVMILFGLWALKKLDRHVRSTGTLGTH